MARSQTLLGLATVGLLLAAPAQAQGVLTVAMTAVDILVTTGSPDQGFEGFRFVAPNPHDALVKSQLDEAGFDVTLQVMDWNALLALARCPICAGHRRAAPSRRAAPGRWWRARPQSRRSARWRRAEPPIASASASW